jgi:rifampicin phosphotransferase
MIQRFVPVKIAFLLALLTIRAVVVRADGLIPPLTSEQIQQGRKTLSEFKTNPKGPYFRIRWFCNDGTVHPPQGTPCRARGGGKQFAELSPSARKLAEWNIDVGVILASLDFPTFLDVKRDHYFLRELVLERYLVEIDQGWIYRQAKSYRGARQVEDEEKAGRQLLQELLANPGWVARNYFLLTRLILAVPHGVPDSVVLKVRALASSIANQDPRFQPIRAKIHSQPSSADLSAVEKFLAERKPVDATQLTELVDLLRQQYAGTGLVGQFQVLRKKLAGTSIAPALDQYTAAIAENREEGLGASLSLEILRQVTQPGDVGRKLELLDLNALVLERAILRSQKNPESATRRQQLAGLLESFRFATGGGLLSPRQFEALRTEIELLVGQNEIPADRYNQAIRYLERSAEWCRATAAQNFGPAAWHYQEVEPLATHLVDQLLRGSVALPLTARLETLVADANRAAGIRHSIFGEPFSRGIVGLNPGLAIGRLGIIDPGDTTAPTIDPNSIYVIPQTLSDLKPMAGILTLDSGNALSHSQLLAANLGIPNATVPSNQLPVLEKHRDQELFYAVTRRGVVVLREKASLTPEERKMWVDQPTAPTRRVDLDTNKLDLTDARILPLSGLGAGDAGVKAGPKAANLGQLAYFFPAQVAPGLVIPFAIYHKHIHQSQLDGKPLDEQISTVFAEAERMRQSAASQSDVDRYINPRLAQIRKTIQTFRLLPEFEQQLAGKMRETFGPDGTYGVFVRSDTNAEDLPEFTGAGLNLTVPNQVGNRQIFQSIKDVWASPFEERAYEWRSRILRSSDKVYPSVLLLLSVPSDKSGVIATVNLETGEGDITVNVSEGVSAVVDGGVAESLLLKTDGTVRLLEQARGTYRKRLRPGGGFINLPVSREDTVLLPDEIRQLRDMVAEVKRKYPPAKTDKGEILPWDIEFGFVKGQLRLFQIRPLVRYQEVRTLEALSRLDAGAGSTSVVRLDEKP